MPDVPLWLHGVGQVLDVSEESKQWVKEKQARLSYMKHSVTYNKIHQASLGHATVVSPCVNTALANAGPYASTPNPRGPCDTIQASLKPGEGGAYPPALAEIISQRKSFDQRKRI